MEVTTKNVVRHSSEYSSEYMTEKKYFQVNDPFDDNGM
jgi:hypothetical protein